MARIRVEDIVEDLSSEFKSALASTVERVIPDAQFDRHELFRAFVRAVGRKCNTWENVPDHYVEL